MLLLWPLHDPSAYCSGPVQPHTSAQNPCPWSHDLWVKESFRKEKKKEGETFCHGLAGFKILFFFSARVLVVTCGIWFSDRD